jgi:cytochrome P450
LKLIIFPRQFESELLPILVGILPSLTARKDLAGREKVFQAFAHYFRIDGHKDGSILVQNRHEVGVNNQVPLEDIARFEVGGAFALLVNTVPAAFWVLLFLYAHPGLLDSIRNEVGLIMVTAVDESGNLTRSLDITSVKTDCPLLASTFQEVLRYRAASTQVRQVQQDTLLEDKWLLKKNAIIQMPSRIIHEDASIWGMDVNDFNPRRFMKNEAQKTGSGKRLNPAAFRAFGGGTTLCPGRHFASTEILAMATMFIMRYDLTPTANEWILPTAFNTKLAAAVMEPDTDIEVELSTRKGFEDGRWAFQLGESEIVFALVAEDRSD